MANLRANDMEGEVTCLQAAGFDNDALKGSAPYDLIFANILKGPLIALAGDLSANLRPGGYAILSGILEDQSADVEAAYAEAGVNLVEKEQIGDWMTLLLQK